jgi:hypothetical protein
MRVCVGCAKSHATADSVHNGPVRFCVRCRLCHAPLYTLRPFHDAVGLALRGIGYPTVGFIAALFAAVCFFVFAAGAAESGPKVAVVSFGLFSDQSVFESEAAGAAQIVAQRYGASAVIVRANTPSRSEATVEALAAALDEAAGGLVAERDVLVVILTSHGSHGGLVVKSVAQGEDTLWPQTLSAMLDHARMRHKVVIISACYAGIFIPPLANADTLVITAADASHPSFGCQDGAQWTYFGEALFSIAMQATTNLRDAFDLARTLVRERELKNGFEPSNPQIAGGASVNLYLWGGLKDAPAVLLPWPAP